MSHDVCDIYMVNLESRIRQMVGSLRKHTEMNVWLSENGQMHYVYEIWKGKTLHSRWCWKERTERWGRMNTPRNKV